MGHKKSRPHPGRDFLCIVVVCGEIKIKSDNEERAAWTVFKADDTALAVALPRIKSEWALFVVI